MRGNLAGQGENHSVSRDKIVRGVFYLDSIYDTKLTHNQFKAIMKKVGNMDYKKASRTARRMVFLYKLHNLLRGRGFRLC